MITPLIYLVLAFIPAGIISLVMDVWYRFQGPLGTAPFSDRLLRPPGESCRQKVEDLNNSLTELDVWILGFPSTFLLCVMSCNLTQPPTWPISMPWAATFALAISASLTLFSRRWILLKERDEWRLNFSGQRAVGEMLNQLQVDGCRVFHDFQLGNDQHLGHIVVAPSGVYAVETRTRPKRARTPHQQAHEVIYDGKSLEYPLLKDTTFLEETRTHGRGLTEFLKANLDFAAPVQPVLALPGWYVIQRGEGDVTVLNPKSIRERVITHNTPVLTSEQIQKIARILEQKSRMLEF